MLERDNEVIEDCLCFFFFNERGVSCIFILGIRFASTAKQRLNRHEERFFLEVYYERPELICE